MKKVLLCLAAFIMSFLAVVVPHSLSSNSYAAVNDRVVQTGLTNRYDMNNIYTDYNNKWFGFSFYNSNAIYPNQIFNVNGQTYYFIATSNYKKLNYQTNTWDTASFSGITPQDPLAFWSDGVNWYYSNEGSNYILNTSTNTWSTVSFAGVSVFSGRNIFTTSTRTYMYYSSKWYLLDNRTWNLITLDTSNISNNNEVVSYGNENIFAVGDYLIFRPQEKSNGDNASYIYYLDNNVWRVLMANNGYSYNFFWSDGFNYYYGALKFDINNNTLVPISWTNNNLSWFNNNFNGSNIWTDNYHIYYSTGTANQVAILFNNIYQAGYNAGYQAGYNAGYQAGVASSSGSSSDYQAGYNAGYQAGINTNAGYQDGYDAGYNIGYETGYTAGSSNGYETGYNNGSNIGYNNGYNAGVEAANDYSFLSLIGAAVDAPLNVFTEVFNFDLLGTNIKSLLLTLFTFSVAIVIMKFLFAVK